MRYVTLHGSLCLVAGTWASGSAGLRRPDCRDDCTVYELGPEVKEPNYGPLVEWMIAHDVAGLHPPLCRWHSASQAGKVTPCDCGLTEALKEAGL